MASAGKYQIDMCHGPLFTKIVRFSVPLIFTNVLGLLFYAADLIVLGRFGAPEAMAAVGATNGLTVLILNVFYGLAAGVNVLAARYIGAKDDKKLSQVVHSSMAVALYGGVVMTIISIIFTKPMLRFMATPSEIFQDAVIYMWICCLGIPAVVFYSFGASIMRATGDTKRPLIYITVAGIINVVLNVFFVWICNMDVVGVGIATKLSNVIAAWLVMRALMRSTDATRLFLKKIKVSWNAFKEIVRIGLPAGVNGALFSVSNISIQSSINSLGWQTIAGNTAAGNLEGIVYVACSSFYHTAISFTGQNHGGRKYKRIIRSIFICAGCTAVVGVLLGSFCIIFGKELLSIYNPDPEIIKPGMMRLYVLMSGYFMCGIMDVITGSLRGLGHSIKPTVVTLLGICAFRVLWVWLIFPLNPTMLNLMISYPVTWVLVSAVNGAILFVVCRNMLRKVNMRNRRELQ